MIGLAGFSGGQCGPEIFGRARIEIAFRGVAAVTFPAMRFANISGSTKRPENAFYTKRFIKLLCGKLKEKEKKYPNSNINEDVRN